MAVFSAGVEQHARIPKAIFGQFRRQLLNVQKTVDIVVHCAGIASLTAVFKNNCCIFCIQRNVSSPVCTQINLLFFKSPMADDHLPDLGIVAVQSVGKEHSGQSCSYIFILGIHAEFLIYNSKIFVNPALFNLFTGKFFHVAPVGVVGLFIQLLIPDHIAVNKCLLVIT